MYPHRFAFVSRHAITPEQAALAAEKNIEVVPVGDIDGFDGDFASVKAAAIAASRPLDGVVVVHAAAALRALHVFGAVGVFESANRAPEGAAPQFKALALHVYHIYGNDDGTCGVVCADDWPFYDPAARQKAMN